MFAALGPRVMPTLTIDWLLTFVRDFALVIWLDGLIVIDFVETPTKFLVAEINRNQAVAVGRALFAALNGSDVMKQAPQAHVWAAINSCCA